MSQGEQKSGVTVEVGGKEVPRQQQMTEPIVGLPGTGEVAGLIASEVERLNLLTGIEQEDTGRVKKSLRIVKIAGIGRTKIKRKEGEMNCSRIDDMIARMGGTSKRKVERGEEQSVSKKRMMGE